MSSRDRSASVLINNYNYGRYVGAAIDSALSQTLPEVEVVVVDDGSTDDSRTVIDAYGERVIRVYQQNGGQAAAMNAGFHSCSGEVVVFLDADDLLEPRALELAMPWFADPSLVKVQWPLLEVNAADESLGRVVPGAEIPDGDLRERVCRDGPATIAWPATSGNAWSRRFLREVLPIDAEVYRIGADSYLFELAPYFGRLKTIAEPLSRYRRHGSNNYSRSIPFDERLAMELRFFDHYCPLLEQWCSKLGLVVDTKQWRANSWWHRMARIAQQLRHRIPDGERFALIDDSTWAMDRLDGRVALPFPEIDGAYSGAPADDAGACAELERNRRRGVRFLVIGWSAGWWLEHYRGFAQRLAATATEVLRDQDLVIYELLPADVTDSAAVNA